MKPLYMQIAASLRMSEAWRFLLTDSAAAAARVQHAADEAKLLERAAGALLHIVQRREKK